MIFSGERQRKLVSMSGTFKSVTDRERACVCVCVVEREGEYVYIPPTGRNYSHPMITIMIIKVIEKIIMMMKINHYDQYLLSNLSKLSILKFANC